MKAFLAVWTVFAVLAGHSTCVSGAYSGDIVAYWNERITYALNASSPRLTSLRESYFGALAHTAIIQAADDSASRSRNVRQTAISIAAHHVLVRHFPAQHRPIDLYAREAEDLINATPRESSEGKNIGRRAAARVITARADDNIDEYVRYEWQPAGTPGVYQPTPPNLNVLPADPAGGLLRPFGGVARLPPYPVAPPSPSSPEYIPYLHQIKEKGGRTDHTRTQDETEIGYYWLESSVTYWNRFARVVIGNTLNEDITKSANFYARLNWAIANAGTIGWEAKSRYNSWRPITALRWAGTPYLADNSTYSFPTWEPLSPTPTHQDYLSGHAVYGGAAARIIALYLGTDNLNPPVTLSSTVALDNVGVLTRTYSSVKAAADENGISRVYVGVHFGFASEEGTKAGEGAADAVWRARGRYL